MPFSKLPAIPKARYSDASQQRQADAIQNMTDILSGRKGSGLDRAVLVRDLADLGLATLKNTGNGVDLGGAGELITSGSGGKSVPVVLPPVPENVTASGAFESILIKWDKPDYTVASPSSHTEIWRNSTNELSGAVLIATTTATLYGDVVGTNASFYYWVRHVNVGYDNSIRYGAYNSADGVLGETSADISNVINDLAEQMRDSDLINELNTDLSDLDSRITDVYENGTKIWVQKETAGDITAGIGLLAKEDGTSEFVVAASNFFVYDPNDPSGSVTPTFAIDNGTVVIPSALIETATIQILNSQVITADYVNAGIEINTPTINSATINGSDIRGSGTAGFGEGGSFNGYNTFIDATGLIQTNNLYASGNIVIDGSGYIGADIEVQGTVSASKVEGVKTFLGSGTFTVARGGTSITETDYDTEVSVPTWGDAKSTYVVEYRTFGAVESSSTSTCSWYVRQTKDPYVVTKWSGGATVYISFTSEITDGYSANNTNYDPYQIEFKVYKIF